MRPLRCPEHGALVEGVPFARYGARSTRDSENLMAGLATKTDKTAICRLVRIDDVTVALSRRRGYARPARPARTVGEHAAKLTAVSIGMGEGCAKSVREHAPQAVICIDDYHVVQLATKALDEVRREHWNELRRAGERDTAKAFKDARWSLLKNPADLTDRQADTLAALKAAGGKTPRAWAMKEMVRAIFAPA